MRAPLILAAATALGLAGGYAWSAMGSRPAAAPKPPKAGFAAMPPSPEELPAAQDRDWKARAYEPDSVYYPGCNSVRAAGKAPLHADDPGYRPEMDGDGDGIACEPIRRY